MANHNGHGGDPAAAEDRIAQYLAAYDDALANDTLPVAAVPRSEFDAQALMRIEQIEAKLRRLRQLRRGAGNLRPPATADPSAATSAHTANKWPDETPTQGSTELPKTFGRFEIVRELGAGGMGVVLLARDPLLNRLVALKIPRPESLFVRDIRQRFVREAQAAARLNHPNLVPVLEASEAGTICYIASTYCEGPNLATWHKEQSAPLASVTAAQIVALLADAIAYAHTQGVLHRDLKPSNVLLEPRAGGDADHEAGPLPTLPFTPRITDFGLAKLDASETNDTRTGAVMGTLAYMAPEQAESTRGAVGRQTDVYGLGAILYELLTGLPPVRGQSDAEMLRLLLTKEPVTPRLLRPSMSRDLEAICLRCLEKEPLRRYETAAALAADLRRFLAGVATLARPWTTRQRLIRWAVRRPAMAGLLGVSALAAVLLASTTMFYVARLGAARQAAEASAQLARSSELAAGEFAYAAHMRQAYGCLELGQGEQIERLLAHYELRTRLAELRGFEWYHLKRRLHSELSTLSGHTGQVYAVAYQPEGHVLASGGQDGLVMLWDPRSGMNIGTIRAHANCVNAVEYSRDGQVLATGSCDHTVKLWSATTHELLAVLQDDSDEVHCLAFSPDDTLLATGGKDGIARVWDLATRTVRVRLDSRAAIHALAWHGDGRKLYLANGKTLVFDFDNDLLAEDRSSSQCIVVPRSNWGVFAGSAYGEVSVFGDGLAEKDTITSLNFHGQVVSALAINGGGNWLAAGSWDRTLRLWSKDGDPYRDVFLGHSDRVQALVFDPGALRVASASFDGTIKTWSMFGESLPRFGDSCFVPPDGDERNFIDFSADLRYVASLWNDEKAHQLYISDLRRSVTIGRLRVRRSCPMFS